MKITSMAALVTSSVGSGLFLASVFSEDRFRDDGLYNLLLGGLLWIIGTLFLILAELERKEQP